MGEAIAYRGVRKVIASRMVESLRSTAQLTYHTAVDVTAISAQLPRWKEEGRGVGLQDGLLHVLARALKQVPDLNGTCDEAGWTPAEEVRFSLALSTETGLVTPVLPAADELDLTALAQARRTCVARARAGELKVSDYRGGTFTVSNLGLTAVEYFTPILNAPQIAILGIGRLDARFVPGPDGAPVPRRVLPLSLTADHRVVDGEPAGRFLSSVETLFAETDWAAC